MRLFPLHFAMVQGVGKNRLDILRAYSTTEYTWVRKSTVFEITAILFFLFLWFLTFTATIIPDDVRYTLFPIRHKTYILSGKNSASFHKKPGPARLFTQFAVATWQHLQVLRTLIVLVTSNTKV